MNLIVMNWSTVNVSGLCSQNQPDHFTCPGATIFYTSSIIWGVIGPQRVFAPGSIYSGLLWFFLLGALLPIPIFIWARKHPKHWLGKIHVPLIFGGPLAIPPATPMNYISWGIVKYPYPTSTIVLIH